MFLIANQLHIVTLKTFKKDMIAVKYEKYDYELYVVSRTMK